MASVLLRPLAGLCLAIGCTGWPGHAGEALPSKDGASGPEADAAPSKAPELSLTDLKGARRNLAELRGRVVLLNFWASWCGPCRKEMPELAALQKEAGSALQVIGASTDDAEDEEEVRRFVIKHRISFSVWLGASPDHMDAFGLPPVLPSSVLIDRQGYIVERFAGTVSLEMLREKIAPLLAASRPSAAPN